MFIECFREAYNELRSSSLTSRFLIQFLDKVFDLISFLRRRDRLEIQLELLNRLGWLTLFHVNAAQVAMGYLHIIASNFDCARQVLRSIVQTVERDQGPSSVNMGRS